MRRPPGPVSIPPWFDFAAHPCAVHRAPVQRFQSHLGSILPGGWGSIPRQPASFNPTLVRFCRLRNALKIPNKFVSIPPWFDFAYRLVRAAGSCSGVSIPPWFDFARTVGGCVGNNGRGFQSHLGSILPTALSAVMAAPALVSIPPWFDFAEIAYRSGVPALLVSIPPWFDFAARGESPAVGLVPRFNPTLVRFCPCPLHARSVAVPRFNPTLVRFCPVMFCWNQFWNSAVSIPPWFDFAPVVHAAGGVDDEFQSHLGSILPFLARFTFSHTRPRFNPTLVRFCPECGRLQGRLTLSVSIPPWFDFALPHPPQTAPQGTVSIPPWFDFAPCATVRIRSSVSVSIPPWFDFAAVG